MIRIRKSMTGAAAGLAVVMLLPVPGFAGGDHSGVPDASTVQSSPDGTQPAHIGMGGTAAGPNMMARDPASGSEDRTGPHQGGGMMGANMMASMMASMMMAPGMTSPEMMRSGMMKSGGGAGHGIDMGAAGDVDKKLTPEDVRANLELSLACRGNKRLEIGEITQPDDATIIAEIVTRDGSLVRRLQVDRRTGRTRDIE